jgi:malonyl-CoA O-methyltransferase
MTSPQSQLIKQNKQRIAHQFSRAAGQYDAVAKVQLDIALDAQAMLPANSSLLLDIGCGTGRITQRLVTQSEQVLAMDLAFGMLQHASITTQKYPEQSIKWLQGDAEQLPVRSHSLDTIFSSMALQWCPHPERVLSELYRVLVPKGQAVLAIMTAGSFTELSHSWANIDKNRHVNEFHSSQTWLQAALKNNLDVDIKTQCYQTWHPNIRHLLASIKGVGANILLDTQLRSSANSRLNRHMLSALEEIYFSQYGADQQLPLSYQITFLHCVK